MPNSVLPPHALVPSMLGLAFLYSQKECCVDGAPSQRIYTHTRGIELLVSFKTLLAEKAYVQIPHECSRLGTGTLGSLETSLGFCAEPGRNY